MIPAQFFGNVFVATAEVPPMVNAVPNGNRISGPAIDKGAVGITLRSAIRDVVNSKERNGCRPRYVNSLRQYLIQFASGREEVPLSAFGVEHLEHWFASRDESITTRAGNVGRLSALFSYAERRGWIIRNPCNLMERVRVDRKPPQILTLSQAKLLMAQTLRHKPNELAFFTLALFAGVRPEEIERLTWDAIRFERERTVVVIDAAASKVRRRRIIEVEPNAREWMTVAAARNARLPVRRMTRRRYLDHAERVLGFERWPQDILRHTAASYLMAKHKNAGLVADKLGNSAGILLTHYRDLVFDEDCEAFWKIRPV